LFFVYYYYFFLCSGICPISVIMNVLDDCLKENAECQEFTPFANDDDTFCEESREHGLLCGALCRDRESDDETDDDFNDEICTDMKKKVCVSNVQ